MNKKTAIRKAAVCFLCVLLCLSLSGCLLRSPSELYALPQQSDAYYNLQTAIEKVVTGTVAYSAPVGGENRQPLQMEDLDGDGKNEAIVFARDASEKPLKIFIFSQKDGSYQLTSTIDGSGASFDSVRYIQMDGSPGQEIVVGRSIGDQVVKSMSVYALHENSTVELFSTNYTAYTTCDLDSDGRTDLFLVRFDTDAQTGSAELYRYNGGVIARDPEASLSNGVTSVKRLVSGYSSSGVPAVFVAGAVDENLITTDVFALKNGAMQNISASADASANTTVRNYYVYSTDIDDDGLIELPQIVTLDSTDSGSTSFQLIRWYNLGLSGTKSYKLLTYHDYSHGYYMTLNDALLGKLTIRQADVDGGVSYVFCRKDSGTQQETELFTIYLLSGEQRTTLANSDSRFQLAEKNEVTYAASLGSGALAAGLNSDVLKNNFHWIHLDWNAGQT